MQTSPPTKDDLNQLLEDLHATGTKPVILATVEPYCEEYVPQTATNKFPQILPELRDEGCLDMPFENLKKVCDGIHVHVNVDQANEMETATQN